LYHAVNSSSASKRHMKQEEEKILQYNWLNNLKNISKQ